jgi:Cu(I)/Ag(I) efflux system membrane protein CusA/SilA
MIGGMATATLLTLLVIPAIYVIWKRLALPRVNRDLADAGLQRSDFSTSNVPGE